MFDKLVVSEPERAGQRDRKSYFLVSSVVVGILFITAVVISIFASDYGIGNGSFELVEIITPPDLAAAPEPQERSLTRSAAALPTRTENMSRPDEPQFVPTAVSTVPNTGMSRPTDRRFEIGRLNTNSTTGGAPDGNGSGRDISGGPGGGLSENRIADNVPDTDPPPVRKDPPNNVVRNIGVVNGKASFLPKPQYPSTALAIRLEGKVDVQVTIDEQGHVTSARAISGHPFFRQVAEQAARNARFTPTLLSQVPVKVTGMIVYNFTRN